MRLNVHDNGTHGEHMRHLAVFKNVIATSGGIQTTVIIWCRRPRVNFVGPGYSRTFACIYFMEIDSLTPNIKTIFRVICDYISQRQRNYYRFLPWKYFSYFSLWVL